MIRMKIEALHIGMRVRHRNTASAWSKPFAEITAEIQFDGGDKRAVAPDAAGLEPAEPQTAVSGLNLPLKQFIEQTVDAAVVRLGLEKPDAVIEKLGVRWHGGKLVMHPADPALQTKEVPLETFFHKIVMVRNNLRVLEQKINAPRKAHRRRKSGDAAIHHAQLRLDDHVQRAVQGKGRPVLGDGLPGRRKSNLVLHNRLILRYVFT